MNIIEQALKELREETDLNESINVSALINDLEKNGISYKEFLDELLDYVSPKTVNDIYKQLLAEKSIKAEEPKAEKPEEQTPSRLSKEAIHNRIRRWFQGKNSYAFLIWKAFLILTGNDLDKEVTRQELGDKFCELSGQTEHGFRLLLAQMCSGSARAYGDVFTFNKFRQTVSVNPVYKDEIRKYID